MNNKKLSIINSLIKDGQYIEAQKKIIELINDEPNNLSYRNLLAIIYVNQNKFDDSIIVLKKIIKQFPRFIDAHINLGNIYADLHQFKKAENCFKYASIIRPNHPLVFYNLANVYKTEFVCVPASILG